VVCRFEPKAREAVAWGRKQFFSEEKNQKTFALDAIPVLWAMTSTLLQAQS
jgi:hypothetical protein